MIIIIFSHLISISIQQQCNTIISKECCVDQCKWENERCQIKENTHYCYLNNNMSGTQCIQNSSCAFYNGKCEPFFKCQAYENVGNNCQTISTKCISVIGQQICVDKPENCLQITENQYCGQIDHKQGMKESCEWINDKCQFIGCGRANEFGQPSTLQCQKFHSVCKFDGIDCRTQLQECIQYKYESNCNSIIAITGKCQNNSSNQGCVNASCYSYMENSFEKCQQHFDQQGVQCIYNNKYLDGLCLEIDYQKQIKKCLMEMPNKSCKQYLSISKCFGINTLKYDQQISFCFDVKNYQERKECDTILTEHACNINETIELKKCQWIQDSCKTINQCSDYKLNFESTDKACDDLNLGCKQISCLSNLFGCCVKKQGCYGYTNEEECTYNFNNITNLLDVCIWENALCRYGRCQDFNNDSYSCNSFTECRYIGKVCLDIKQISCEGLQFEDCIALNCFYIKEKCYDKSQKDKNIKRLSKLLNEDEDTVCQYFSNKLMYCSETDNCRLKTFCQNYDSYYCQSMKQFDNVQCVNINSQCQPMTSCSQLQFSQVEKCYKASSICNTNGKICQIAQELCTLYKTKESCNFQLDQSICQWNNNTCNLKRCEDIQDINKCDSKNLCMDPQVCRQYMCIKYNTKCLTIKSRCSLYNSNENCYKSIVSYCFWTGQNCLDLMSCSILSFLQCKDERYNHSCIYDQVSNQCRNRKGSEIINQTNSSCLQNNKKYGYYCTTEQYRDQMILLFKNS